MDCSQPSRSEDIDILKRHLSPSLWVSECETRNPRGLEFPRNLPLGESRDEACGSQERPLGLLQQSLDTA